jgi:CheY-like chemotaxis protein
MIALESEPIRILLVDDNPADAMLAQELIGETNIPAVVSVVTDGERAINLIEKMLVSKVKMPELVLLDLNMPKRNGHEVLRLLRGMPDIMTMLIVIYTGSRSPFDLETARVGGANGYIVKPIDAQEIDETIVAFKELLLLLAEMKSNDNC